MSGELTRLPSGGALTQEMPPDLADFFDPKKNMDTVETLTIPVVKIAHQNQMFDFGEGTDPVRRFKARAIAQRRRNAFWIDSDRDDDAPSVPPDCASSDGIKPDFGEKKQSATCALCPKNVFGSDDNGRGKACKNMISLALRIEEDGGLLPKRLEIPPSSIRSFSSFLTGLTDRRLPLPLVVTEFSLEKKAIGQQVFSVIKATPLSVVEDRSLWPAIKDDAIQAGNLLSAQKFDQVVDVEPVPAAVAAAGEEKPGF